MAKYQSHHFKVPRTAHYYTLGTPSPSIEQLWLVCHGYGQLGSEIIHKFERFDNGKHLIVAAEGLSRFYWGGVKGKVAASWMTKGDRLHEIEDYANMMQAIYNIFVKKLSPSVEINLFGFSQGVATQVRWIMAKKPHFDRLIIWSGAFPEDLDYRPESAYFKGKTINWHHGDQDEFLPTNILEWHRNFTKDQNLSVVEYPFIGGHHVPRKELEKYYLVL